MERRLWGWDADFEAHLLAWTIFAIYVGVLLAVDVTCLHTPLSAGRLSLQTAVKLTLFWLVSGVCFDFFIWACLGADASVGFMQGFLLEYMLSFDNLFVFHLVFAYYCTPEALLYRALYFGIAGAIVLRIVFLGVGYTFMNSGVYFFKFLFGAILVWSGIRSAGDFDDEDTVDPTNNRFISWVTRNLPVSDNYEPHGHFFVMVAEVECRPPRSSSTCWEEEPPEVPNRERGPEAGGGVLVSEVMAAGAGLPRLESFEGSSLLDPHRGPATGAGPGPQGGDWNAPRGTSADSFEVLRKPARLKRKASLLLLVVVAVWVVDLIFAVDSVASKLASVSDVFLNCSSSAFAMLSLRSLFFVMESLTRTFQMLKYGISAILILIGLKLVFAGWVVVSDSVSFAVILGIMVASMASSYWLPRFRDNCERLEIGPMGTIAEMEEEEEGQDRRDFFHRRAAAEEEGAASFSGSAAAAAPPEPSPPAAGDPEAGGGKSTPLVGGPPLPPANQAPEQAPAEVDPEAFVE